MTDYQITQMVDTFNDTVTVDATDLGTVSVAFRRGDDKVDMLFTKKQARRLAKALRRAAVVAQHVAE